MMYRQTQTKSSTKSPGAIIVTAVIAAGLITVQYMFFSIHDGDSVPAYAQEDVQGSIVYFDSGYNYNTSGLLDSSSFDMSGSSSSWIDTLAQGIGEMRDDLLSLIPEKISSTTIEDLALTMPSSGMDNIPISPSPSTIGDNKDIHCDKASPRDIVLLPGDMMSRALDHCLVMLDDDNNIYPDAIITHDMMLVIADRAGFDVDLDRGSAELVTSDDLKRFLDYLIVSKQIDGVPAKTYSKNITKREYLTLLHDIIPRSRVLPEANVPEFPSLSVLDNTQKSSSLTIAQFKQRINTKLAIPLPIMSYDATIVATPEIQSSILIDLINGGTTSVSHGVAPIDDTVSIANNPLQGGGIGLNKETLKSILGGLLKEI